MYRRSPIIWPLALVLLCLLLAAGLTAYREVTRTAPVIAPTHTEQALHDLGAGLHPETYRAPLREPLYLTEYTRDISPVAYTHARQAAFIQRTDSASDDYSVPGLVQGVQSLLIQHGPIRRNCHKLTHGVVPIEQLFPRERRGPRLAVLDVPAPAIADPAVTVTMPTWAAPEPERYILAAAPERYGYGVVYGPSRETVSVPEPATGLLMFGALLMLVGARRRG